MYDMSSILGHPGVGIHDEIDQIILEVIEFTITSLLICSR